MKKQLFMLLLGAAFCSGSISKIQAQTNPLSATSDATLWTVNNITGNNFIERPYEMIYGPDHHLWITERRDDRSEVPDGGRRIVRVDTTGANKTTMINLGAKVYTTANQDGVLGIVAHPDLYANPATTTNNYVYVSYTYSIDGTDSGRRLRIARLLYDFNTGTLSEDTSLNPNGTIIEGLPASNDHNSGKLAIGPDLKLYYTLGDQGNNQFSRNCIPTRARELPVNTFDFSRYEGKLLRLNLDGTIPSDNPILNGVRTHVWNYGHRNMQGLIITSFGIIYSTEHGDRVDDELNVMVAAKDYGWPEIAGLYDNLGYEFTNNSLTTGCGGSLNTNQATNTEFESFPSNPPADFVPPISNMGTGSATIPTGSNSTWPTIAPAGLAVYENTDKKIKDWGNFVLVPSLKFNNILLGQLSTDGQTITNVSAPGDALFSWHSANSRFRQIVVAPNGVSFYYVTDNTSANDPGAVVKIEYLGPIESTLSTDDFTIAEKAVKIYPNPATQAFNLQFNTKDFSKASVQIVNMNGQIVREMRNVESNIPINISSLQSGLYLVNISDGKNFKTVKKLMVAQ